MLQPWVKAKSQILTPKVLASWTLANAFSVRNPRAYFTQRGFNPGYEYNTRNPTLKALATSMRMSSGQELLEALKTGSQATFSIPVGDPFTAKLRPVVTAAGNLNVHDVRVLTSWRNRFVRSFLTDFEATEERTKTWLTEVVGPDPTRILFMLDDVHGRTIGYLGLAFIDWQNRTGEADAIVRGVDNLPGIMTKALLALLRWAHHELKLTTALNVRVRSDNPAVHFYLKLGTEMRRVPLREIEEPDMKRWVEDESLASSSTELVYITFHRHLYE